MPDVGLCLCAFDLLKISEGKVLYGDGCVYHKGASERPPAGETTSEKLCAVEFTVVVFKPFVGEAIVGRVSQSNEQGVTGEPASSVQEQTS